MRRRRQGPPLRRGSPEDGGQGDGRGRIASGEPAQGLDVGLQSFGVAVTHPLELDELADRLHVVRLEPDRRLEGRFSLIETTKAHESARQHQPGLWRRSPLEERPSSRRLAFREAVDVPERRREIVFRHAAGRPGSDVALEKGDRVVGAPQSSQGGGQQTGRLVRNAGSSLLNERGRTSGVPGAQAPARFRDAGVPSCVGGLKLSHVAPRRKRVPGASAPPGRGLAARTRSGGVGRQVVGETCRTQARTSPGPRLSTSGRLRRRGSVWGG